jgi:1,4-dihydroxy-2-naphthoyl-CoA hydrolase
VSDPQAPPNRGFDATIGVEWAETTPTRVVARLRIEAQHLQPYGIVHGGVYCSVAESVASIGAHLNGMQHDPQNGAVGLENHTTFLRAVGEGSEITFEATPLHAGRRTQAWQVSIRDEKGRDVAASRVRLMILRTDSI